MLRETDNALTVAANGQVAFSAEGDSSLAFQSDLCSEAMTMKPMANRITKNVKNSIIPVDI